jgi:L-aspartate oxidase
LLSGQSVFLDISMIPSFHQRFPTVTKICREAGIDLDDGLLPVAPGAHFLMGGVLADQHGRTDLPGLYAVGETACTGVHGANRLASNSLLEGIVFAQETARTILADNTVHTMAVTKGNPSPSERGIVLPSKQAIQDMMTDHVGIVRDHSGLTKAKSWFERYAPFFAEINSEWPVESIERINMLTTGWLITTSALERTESRGGHFRKDYPHKSKRWYKKRIERRKLDEPSQIERKAAAIFP